MVANPTRGEVQSTYDVDCVMRLAAEKQARRTAAELTKGERHDE